MLSVLDLTTVQQSHGAPSGPPCADGWITSGRDWGQEDQPSPAPKCPTECFLQGQGLSKEQLPFPQPEATQEASVVSPRLPCSRVAEKN